MQVVSCDRRILMAGDPGEAQGQLEVRAGVQGRMGPAAAAPDHRARKGGSVTLLAGYAPAQYAIMASDLPLA